MAPKERDGEQLNNHDKKPLPPSYLIKKNSGDLGPSLNPSSYTKIDNNNNLRVNNSSNTSDEDEEEFEIVWRSVVLLSIVHLMGGYGGLLLITGYISLKTFSVSWAFGMLSAIGTTAGAHRLWAHKAYKARLPLQIFLMLCQTVACQNSIYEWCRDHRVHHKFTETDADPHNAKRGFFFAHMGWLMCRKHPHVKTKGKKVDMSDLAKDPVVIFQRKYYFPLILVFSFLLPTLTIWWSGETLAMSWHVTMLRYILSLHFTWLVNSAAHMWGHKPYDNSINPSENPWVAFFAGGEGWHNYHHAFPYDYKAAELGLYKLNTTTMFLDLCAMVGLAYDLKTVPKEVVENRMKRCGDGSQYRH